MGRLGVRCGELGMDRSWRAVKIGELTGAAGCGLQTGPFGSQLHAHDYDDAGPVRVVPTSAVGAGRLSVGETQRISSAKGESLSRHAVRTGDILFARRGAQATGLSALVRPEQAGWLAGTGVIRLRPDPAVACSGFLSAVLNGEAAKQWIRQHAIGATMPNLNEGIIKQIPILLPPLQEQRGIAAILGALDDKIELNRKMNRTLEDVAQAIFKSWFIDFDGHDDLVDSEMGPIPRGWVIAGIDRVSENARETVDPAKVAPESPYVGLEHVPRRSAALSDWGSAAEADSTKAQFAAGDILFGKLRPYFHKVVPVGFAGIASTDILVVRPRTDSWRWFAFGHLFSDEMVAHATAASDGTKMPRTRWSDLCRRRIAIPPPEVASRFNLIVAPLYARILINVLESRTLAQLRDTLLPKLISGEIRVPEAEAAVSEAV